MLLSKKHNIPKKSKEKSKENYKDISTYKPTGKFIYNDELEIYQSNLKSLLFYQV